MFVDLKQRRVRDPATSRRRDGRARLAAALEARSALLPPPASSAIARALSTLSAAPDHPSAAPELRAALSALPSPRATLEAHRRLARALAAAPFLPPPAPSELPDALACPRALPGASARAYGRLAARAGAAEGVAALVVAHGARCAEAELAAWLGGVLAGAAEAGDERVARCLGAALAGRCPGLVHSALCGAEGHSGRGDAVAGEADDGRGGSVGSLAEQEGGALEGQREQLGRGVVSAACGDGCEQSTELVHRALCGAEGHSGRADAVAREAEDGSSGSDGSLTEQERGALEGLRELLGRRAASAECGDGGEQSTAELLRACCVSPGGMPVTAAATLLGPRGIEALADDVPLVPPCARVHVLSSLLRVPAGARGPTWSACVAAHSQEVAALGLAPQLVRCASEAPSEPLGSAVLSAMRSLDVAAQSALCELSHSSWTDAVRLSLFSAGCSADLTSALNRLASSSPASAGEPPGDSLTEPQLQESAMPLILRCFIQDPAATLAGVLRKCALAAGEDLACEVLRCLGPCAAGYVPRALAEACVEACRASGDRPRLRVVRLCASLASQGLASPAGIASEWALQSALADGSALSGVSLRVLESLLGLEGCQRHIFADAARIASAAAGLCSVACAGVERAREDRETAQRCVEALARLHASDAAVLAALSRSQPPWQCALVLSDLFPGTELRAASAAPPMVAFLLGEQLPAGALAVDTPGEALAHVRALLDACALTEPLASSLPRALASRAGHKPLPALLHVPLFARAVVVALSRVLCACTSPQAERLLGVALPSLVDRGVLVVAQARATMDALGRSALAAVLALEMAEARDEGSGECSRHVCAAVKSWTGAGGGAGDALWLACRAYAAVARRSAERAREAFVLCLDVAGACAAAGCDASECLGLVADPGDRELLQSALNRSSNPGS
eukprot:m51a1_g12367 hypothetical protein (922) ;mRNA; r:587837-590602